MCVRCYCIIIIVGRDKSVTRIYKWMQSVQFVGLGRVGRVGRVETLGLLSIYYHRFTILGNINDEKTPFRIITTYIMIYNSYIIVV